MTTHTQNADAYANVNGIRMYYETHGSGTPLVLIHGGGSTIESSFGTIIPMLARRHRIIAMELQAHGRTSDRNAPERFEQDADDVAELLRQLHIDQADILGFSNGGQTAMMFAVRHPNVVRKLILCSAFYKRSGMIAGFWDGFKQPSFDDMPQALKAAFLNVKKDPAALLNMHHKDVERMQTFVDWTDEMLRSIQVPTLIINGDQDVIRSEHAVEMHRLIPNSRLAIFPGTHGSYMGEIMSPDPASKIPEFFVQMVEEVLQTA